MAHFMLWLLPALAKHPSRILFKQFITSAPSPLWISIIYQTFLDDLGRSAAYWARTLGEQGLKQTNPMGLWITGVVYSDLVHIYGIARAGFIFEVLNAKMAASTVRDLLAKTGGRALVYDPSLWPMSWVAYLAIPDFMRLPAPSSLLPVLPAAGTNDIITYLPHERDDVWNT
ncbi:hypothetical protein FB451DRAFT_1489915 [Mycena latifolia]|nr:hypothetical protein FB451DRAFT_1489915 [Mycena latifolia]